MGLVASASIKICLSILHEFKGFACQMEAKDGMGFFSKFSILPKLFSMRRLGKDGGWVQKFYDSWKNWFVSHILNVKAYKLSTIWDREILGLSKVELFSNQNKTCTTYWPKDRLLMKINP